MLNIAVGIDSDFTGIEKDIERITGQFGVENILKNAVAAGYRMRQAEDDVDIENAALFLLMNQSADNHPVFRKRTEYAQYERMQ